MTTYITNAFSFNMLKDKTGLINHLELSLEDATKWVQSNSPISVVGHEDTASVFSSVLKQKIEFNRKTLQLVKLDSLLIGQYIGPRMEEGCKELPSGAEIKWLIITIN